MEMYLQFFHSAYSWIETLTMKVLMVMLYNYSIQSHAKSWIWMPTDSLLYRTKLAALSEQIKKVALSNNTGNVAYSYFNWFGS